MPHPKGEFSLTPTLSHGLQKAGINVHFLSEQSRIISVDPAARFDVAIRQHGGSLMRIQLLRGLMRKMHGDFLLAPLRQQRLDCLIKIVLALINIEERRRSL